MGSCVRGCDCKGTVAGGLAVGLLGSLDGSGYSGWVIGFGLGERGRETLLLNRLLVIYPCSATFLAVAGSTARNSILENILGKKSLYSRACGRSDNRFESRHPANTFL